MKKALFTLSLLVSFSAVYSYAQTQTGEPLKGTVTHKEQGIRIEIEGPVAMRIFESMKNFRTTTSVAEIGFIVSETVTRNGVTASCTKVTNNHYAEDSLKVRYFCELLYNEKVGGFYNFRKDRF